MYYLPRPTSQADLVLMPRLDKPHLEHPFMGARMLRDQLAQGGRATSQRVSVSACKAFCDSIFLAGFDEVLRVLGEEEPVLDQGLHRCFDLADIVRVAAIALFE